MKWFAIPLSSGPYFVRKSKRVPKKKHIYFCFTDYAKAFDCVDHNKLWKILKEMGIPDHLTRLLRNLYSGKEAIVRIGHGLVTKATQKQGMRRKEWQTTSVFLP